MSGCANVSYVHCDSYEMQDVSLSLRRALALLGLPDENPFSAFLKPGMTVFVKPNWVASRWRASCDHDGDLYSVITHPVVVEAVVDLVAEALGGKGRIIVGDNPSIDADFEELMERTDLRRLTTKYDVPCEILDLRPLVCDDLANYGKKDKMVVHRGDPCGTHVVNLGKDSQLYGVNPKLFRGVFDERDETVAAHTGDTQLYGFSRSFYEADAYISIPKMKTHHKVGATLNLKGLVGAITEKNHLVHWRIGFPAIGGDEYPNFVAWFKSKFAKVKERGAWNGNDTIWRMVVDLYHAMQLRPRVCFSIVDGIVGGEGKGPFCVYPKESNALLAGYSLLDVDLAAVRLMGFDAMQIPYLRYFIDNERPLESVLLISEQGRIHNLSEQLDDNFDYLPAEHWKNLREDGRWR